MKAWRLALALLWHTIRGRGGDTVYIDPRGLSDRTEDELTNVSLSVTEMSWVGDEDRFMVLVAEPEDREAAEFWRITHPTPMSEDDARPIVDELTAKVAQLQAVIRRLEVESAQRNNVTVSEYIRIRKTLLHYEDMLLLCREQHGGNLIPDLRDVRSVLLEPTWAEVDQEKRAADQ